MKNFGPLKSKIEALLIESYKKKTFKNELKNFKSLVLENDNAKKLFYIYDNLSTPQDFSTDVSKLFIEESVNIINRLSKKTDLKKINEWVKNVKTENQYRDIDNLFTNNVTKIKTIIESRENIIKVLNGTKTKQEVINLPLKTMLNIANKSVSSLVNELNEEEVKEFNHIISLDDKAIVENFNTLKEDITKKLENILLEQTEIDMVKTINDTIGKINSETPTSFSYYKLLKLSETI